MVIIISESEGREKSFCYVSKLFPSIHRSFSVFFFAIVAYPGVFPGDSMTTITFSNSDTNSCLIRPRNHRSLPSLIARYAINDLCVKTRCVLVRSAKNPIFSSAPAEQCFEHTHDKGGGEIAASVRRITFLFGELQSCNRPRTGNVSGEGRGIHFVNLSDKRKTIMTPLKRGCLEITQDRGELRGKAID